MYELEYNINRWGGAHFAMLWISSVPPLVLHPKRREGVFLSTDGDKIIGEKKRLACVMPEQQSRVIWQTDRLTVSKRLSQLLLHSVSAQDDSLYLYILTSVDIIVRLCIVGSEVSKWLCVCCAKGLTDESSVSLVLIRLKEEEMCQRASMQEVMGLDFCCVRRTQDTAGCLVDLSVD